MFEIWKQNKGVLEKVEDINMYKEINTYRRGVFEFTLEERPVCNVCGSDLIFIKKGKYLLIHKCLNANCETNNKNLKKGATIKHKAFLPKHIFLQISDKRKTNNSFNIDFLVNKKGLSFEEANQYINEQKIARKQYGANKTKTKKEYLIEKYGSEELATKNIRESNKLCIEYWLKRGYSEEEAKLSISKIQSENSKKVKRRKSLSKNELAKRGIDVNCFMREKSIRCKEYWLKRGYSEEEAIENIKQLQSKYSKQRDPNKIKESSHRCKEYWLKIGYSEEEAKIKIKELQTTFSLEKCIEKYGEEEGLKIFQNRQNNWQKTLHNNGNLHVGYSKISQDLFNELYKYSGNNEVYFGSLNREFTIFNESTKRVFAYDFTDLTNKKIIEFQGDAYHANPKLFKEDAKPSPFNDLTSKEIWENDKMKYNFTINKGFDVLLIWEYDYKHNKEEVINECLSFLNYGEKIY